MKEIPLGFGLAVCLAGLIWWILVRTTLGFEIETIGRNPHAAHYAGIEVTRRLILTIFISGCLAGIGGTIETLGVVNRFQPEFNVGLGFKGITTALLARAHPLGVIPAALL